MMLLVELIPGSHVLKTPILAICCYLSSFSARLMETFLRPFTRGMIGYPNVYRFH
ncbi:unnamed protein product [Tenebrio molitor]|nr:unnamed protein product [Tenebrio molitor]